MSDKRSSDVLGGLPHSRPHRRSDKRGARAAPIPEESGASEMDSATTASGASGSRRQTRSKQAGARAKPKPKATSRSTGTPASGRAAAEADGRAAAKASRRPASRSARKPPRLQQPAQPSGTPSRSRPERPDQGERHEVLGTALQAATELAEIGLTVGVRMIRSAVSRLPRP